MVFKQKMKISCLKVESSINHLVWFFDKKLNSFQNELLVSLGNMCELFCNFTCLNFPSVLFPMPLQTMMLLAVDTDVYVNVELSELREDIDWNQWNCLLSNITTLCTRVTERHGHWEPWVDQQRSP